jgi:hypothetical protein
MQKYYDTCSTFVKPYALDKDIKFEDLHLEERPLTDDRTEGGPAEVLKQKSLTLLTQKGQYYIWSLDIATYRSSHPLSRDSILLVELLRAA